MEAAPSSNPPQNGALRPAHDTRLNGLAHALSRQCDGAIGRTAGPATEISTSSPARRARATTLGATAPSPASPWRGQQAPACTPSGVAVGKDRGPCSIRRGVGWAMWTVWTVWTVSPSAQITEGHRRASAGLPAASGQLERGPARPARAPTLRECPRNQQNSHDETLPLVLRTVSGCRRARASPAEAARWPKWTVWPMWTMSALTQISQPPEFREASDAAPSARHQAARSGPADDAQRPLAARGTIRSTTQLARILAIRAAPTCPAQEPVPTLAAAPPGSELDETSAIPATSSRPSKRPPLAAQRARAGASRARHRARSDATSSAPAPSRAQVHRSSPLVPRAVHRQVLRTIPRFDAATPPHGA